MKQNRILDRLQTSGGRDYSYLLWFILGFLIGWPYALPVPGIGVIGVLGLLGLAGLAALLLANQRAVGWGLSRSPLTYLVLGVVIWSLASWALSVSLVPAHASLAWEGLASSLKLVGFSLLLFVGRRFRQVLGEGMAPFLNGFKWGMVLLALMAAAAFFATGAEYNWFPLNVSRYGVSQALPRFGFPGYAPSLMAGALLLCLGDYLWSPRRGWLNISAALVLMGVILISTSRTAWIMAASGILLLMLYVLISDLRHREQRFSDTRRLLLPLIGAGLLLLGGFVALPVLATATIDRLLRFLVNLEESGVFNSRVFLWRDAQGYVAAFPLFGSGGIGPFYLLGPEIGQLHNEWVDAYFRYGFPGLALNILLLGYLVLQSLRSLWQQLRLGVGREPSLIAPAIFLVTLVIYMIFQVISRHPTIGPFFYLLAGYLECSTQNPGQQASHAVQPLSVDPASDDQRPSGPAR